MWYISGLFGVKLGYIELCIYVCSNYNLQCKRCPNAVSLVLNTGKCKHLIFHMSSTSLITFLIKRKGDRRWRGKQRAWVRKKKNSCLEHIPQVRYFSDTSWGHKSPLKPGSLHDRCKPSASWLLFSISPIYQQQKGAVLRWDRHLSLHLQGCSSNTSGPNCHGWRGEHPDAGKHNWIQKSSWSTLIWSCSSNMNFHLYVAIQSFAVLYCSDNLLSSWIWFFCILQDYCVRESCFVCVSLHRCFMEVWMHAYVQIGMLNHILLNHFTAWSGINV